MSSLSERLSALSPEKRLLLELMRRGGAGEAADRPRPAPAEPRPHLAPFALVAPEDREKLPPGLEDAYPLTSLQMGMLYHMELTLDDRTPAYHNVNSFHLKGPFDPEVFERAVQRIVDRHAILRTSFDLSSYGEPLQLVHRTARMPIAIEDLTHLPHEEQRQELRRFFDRENRRLLDLGRPPLMRFHVHRRSERTFQLTVTEPHAISDGWSTTSTLSEIFTTYFTLLRGEPLPEEPPPATSFRDFVFLERQALGSEETRRFWEVKLAGATPLRLPRWPAPPPAPPVSPGRRYHRKPTATLPPVVLSGLQRLARSLGIPVKSALLAAHVKALSLLTGQEDVLTGLTMHGRPEDLDGERIRGLFLNTVPYRLKLSDASWSELARLAFDTEVELLPHRRYPLPALQRQLGEQDLIETSFSFLHFHSVERLLTSGDLEFLDAGHSDRSVTHFALGATFVFDLVGAPSLTVTLEHGPELREDQMLRALGLYERVLTAMASDPASSHLCDWLSGSERHQALVEWNDTTPPWALAGSVPELVAAHVRRDPVALAAGFGAERLTYGELGRRAWQLARELQARGVGPEVPVALCLERPAEVLVGLVGILWAGGAFLPLDPAYPRERLAFMLEDARPAVLLTQDRLIARLPETGVPVLRLDSEWPVVARRSGEPLPLAPDPEGLAYVIYTSGSTGTPKGVEVRHRGFLNMVRMHQQEHTLTPADRSSQVASLSFDVSVGEIWMALGTGASVWFPDPVARTSPPELAAFLLRHEITACILASPVGEALLEEPLARELKLRSLILGGDRLRRAPEPPLPFLFTNNYGPTEGTLVATWDRVDASTSGPPPIGRPVPGVRVYLLDAHGNPVPPGAAGELCIAGEGLARGYRHRPDATAEKFVPDPFSGEPGARLYRTGDLARHLPDGRLDFLGRRDAQVKIRGFRIEPAEIEAALLGSAEVREAVVVAREDGASHARLVAYLVPATPPGPPADALRALLRRTLPEHMVPSVFVPLSSLPRTPNGKLDRRALPPPQAAASPRELVPPRTPLEERLAVLWSEVLRVGRVGVHDNFFELGGDSILSLRIVGRAHREGIRLAVHQIFEHPTIAELARVAGQAPGVAAEQGPVTGPVPLTPIQSWFFAAEPPDPHHFNQSVLLETREPLDPAAVARALEALLAHHDALRLRFFREGSDWRQEIAAPGGEAPFSRIDLAALPRPARRGALEAAAAALQASLDLERGPLVRLALFDLGAEERGRLLWIVHHLVVDGLSWRVLLEDLESAYRQTARGEPAALGAKTTSFRQWALRLAGHARSPTLLQELEGWLAKPFPAAPELPRDHPGDGGGTEASVRRVTVTLDPGETRSLLELPGARADEVLLTALVQALQRWTGSPRLLVQLEGHGREEIAEGLDLSRTVGWFTALYPVLLDLGSAVEPEEALAAVQRQLRSVPGRGIGFGALRFLGDPEAAARLRRVPVPEVSFNYLGQFDEVLAGSSPFVPAAESAGPVHSARQPRRHLLEVGGSVVGGELRLSWELSETVHRKETIEKVARDFLERLRALLDRGRSGPAGAAAPDSLGIELDPELLAKIYDEIESA